MEVLLDRRGEEGLIMYRAGVAAAWLLVLGCGHQPAVSDPLPVPIVLPEQQGGDVANVIGKLTGQTPYGITIPGLPPILFSNATDACLQQHEQKHVEQQREDKPVKWTLKYITDFTACMGPGSTSTACRSPGRFCEMRAHDSL
jgi:hypothetical protein